MPTNPNMSLVMRGIEQEIDRLVDDRMDDYVDKTDLCRDVRDIIEEETNFSEHLQQYNDTIDDLQEDITNLKKEIEELREERKNLHGLLSFWDYIKAWFRGSEHRS